MNQIFQPRLFAIFPVPEIALSRHHGNCNLNGMLTIHIKKRLRQGREGFGFTMRHSKATASNNGIALDLAAYYVADKSKIVGVDVYVVPRRDSNPDLKFAR